MDWIGLDSLALLVVISLFFPVSLTHAITDSLYLYTLVILSPDHVHSRLFETFAHLETKSQ